MWICLLWQPLVAVKIVYLCKYSLKELKTVYCDRPVKYLKTRPDHLLQYYFLLVNYNHATGCVLQKTYK
jgi:hypothetical protein